MPSTCLSVHVSLLPQVTYYRYFRFFGDGRVAYGLVHEGPKEFVRMLQVGSKEERQGRAEVQDGREAAVLLSLLV